MSRFVPLKNILIMLDHFKFGGGIEKIAQTIGNELNLLGHNVIYFGAYDSEHEIELVGLKIYGNQKISSNRIMSLYSFLCRAKKISANCNKNNINTCIAHTDGNVVACLLSKLLYKNKSKIIYHIHFSIHILPWWTVFIYYIIYRYCDKVVCINREDYSILRNKYPELKDKFVLIHNPIPLQEINTLREESVSLEENLFGHNKFTFIHIGRLTQQKNQILLIRSFLDLNKIYPNMQLIILGEGELKNFLLKNCDSNKNIIFLGNKDNPYAYIRLSDTLVLSSEYEGYPTVLLESLACGTPTISTDCMTGPRDILAGADDKLPRYGNNFIVCKYGVLTPVNNQYVLTKAMEFMYLNPQKRLYYKKFGLRRSKFFDIKKVIIQWIDII